MIEDYHSEDRICTSCNKHHGVTIDNETNRALCSDCNGTLCYSCCKLAAYTYVTKGTQ